MMLGLSRSRTFGFQGELVEAGRSFSCLGRVHVVLEEANVDGPGFVSGILY